VGSERWIRDRPGELGRPRRTARRGEGPAVGARCPRRRRAEHARRPAVEVAPPPREPSGRRGIVIPVLVGGYLTVVTLFLIFVLHLSVSPERLLLLMLIASLISFLVVQAIVTQHNVQHSLFSAGALRTVIGAALFLTVLSALCLGLGTILRNTAGGIAAFVGLLFVLPGISAILPSSVDNAVSPYLPLNAGTTVANHTFDSPHHLAVWTGFALFCGYAAVAIIGAAMTIVRRDA